MATAVRSRAKASAEAKLNKDKRIVYIEWQDACNSAYWGSPGDTDTTLVDIKSIGWLMEEHEDRYVLSVGYHPIDEGKTRMSGFFSVPKAWIKKFVEIDV